MLGVSFDSVEENRDFAQKFDFPFDLLCDLDRSVGLAYGAAETEQDGHAKRIAYLIDKDGVIRYAWDKVDVKSHAASALEQLAYL